MDMADVYTYRLHYCFYFTLQLKNIILGDSLTFFEVSLIIRAPCFERPCKKEQLVQAKGVHVHPVQN